MSTVYDVSVRYNTTGNAGAGLKDIATHAQSASESALSLKSILLSIGGFEVLRKAKEAFIDFNSFVEQSTISLAAQEKIIRGGPWAKAMENATNLFKHYQQVAKASIGETRDFLEVHKGIAGQAYRVGYTTEEIKKLTKGTFILGKVLGERTETTIMDIKQMLTGQVMSRDRLSQIILASQQKDQEQYKKMTQKQQKELIFKALTDPAIELAAKQMEKTYEGVTSTLKDNLSIAFGKVGLPLFQRITAEVDKWNTWIDKNPEQIKVWSDSVAGYLIRGFNEFKKFVKQIEPLVSYLAKKIGSNLKLLADNLWILKAYFAFNAIKTVGGGAFAGISGIITAFGGTVSGTTAALKGFAAALWANAGRLGLAGAAGAAGYLGMQAVDEWTEKNAKEYNKTRQPGEVPRRGFTSNLAALAGVVSGQWADIDAANLKEETAGRLASRRAQIASMVSGYADLFGKGRGEAQYRTASGFLSAHALTREFAQAQVIENMRRSGYGDREIAPLLNDLKDVLAKLPLAAEFPAKLLAQLKAAALVEESEKYKKLNPDSPSKTNVNVHISKVEVASADPDRFVFGMVRAFEQVGRNPTQANSALRGAF